jgi:pterin-4a-carbinolamine dehydratase
MSRKQMEGDNQRRRTLARQARERGKRASEAGVSLGASKQFEHIDEAYRAGPPPAGGRKPVPGRGTPDTAPQPPLPAPDSPRLDPEIVGGEPPQPAGVAYRELVAEVGRRAGVNFDEARVAAVAAVTALAHALDERDRQRLLDVVPATLHDEGAPASGNAGLSGFLDDVVQLTHRDRDQARYQAQAALSALADQDRGLVESLDLPTDLRDLLAPPPVGGGMVDAVGRTATLTADEVRGALADLPYWSGDPRALSRLLVLPPGNLERALARLAQLRHEVGRAPHVGRRGDTQAVLVVRTASVGGVTAADLDLAHAVEAAIDEVGAGIAS